MDAEILHAIWFDCKDLSDSQHKLLLALAYHGVPAGRHSPTFQDDRQTVRQTRTLLTNWKNRLYQHQGSKRTQTNLTYIQ